MNDNFWGRVLGLLEKQDISRKEFAAQLGISYSSIHNGISLGSIPSADVALKIAGKLDTTIEYLVFGNTENYDFFKNSSPKNQEQFLYRKNKDLINAIENLSPDVRVSIRDLIIKIGKN